VNALPFLVAALAISFVGSSFLWIRHRQPRKTLTSGISDFERQMSALRPDDPTGDNRPGRPRQEV
jgi:hypothetical protein